MNNSQETAINKAADHFSSAAPEESSWTSYFEEFLWQNDGHMTLKSLVSDAASSVKKAACVQDDHTKKLLRLKKRKTKGVVIDDSLEDTATSPVNSPKEKAGSCGEENNPNIDELNKRGLCLVPLSSLADYLS